MGCHPTHFIFFHFPPTAHATAQFLHGCIAKVCHLGENFKMKPRGWSSIWCVQHNTERISQAECLFILLILMPCCSFANPTSTPSTGLGRVWLAWRLMLAVHLALSTFPTFLSILLDLQFFLRKWLARLASSKVIQESDGVRCFARQKKQSTQSSASWKLSKCWSMFIACWSTATLMSNTNSWVACVFPRAVVLDQVVQVSPATAAKQVKTTESHTWQRMKHCIGHAMGRYIIMWYLHREIPRAPGSLMRASSINGWSAPLESCAQLSSYLLDPLRLISSTCQTPTMLGYIPALRDLFLTLDFITESREPSTRPPSQPASPTSRRRARRKRCPNLFLAKFKVQRASDKGRCTLAWKKQSMQTILSSFDDYSNPFTKHKQELCLRGSAKFSISILEGTHGQEKQNQGGNKPRDCPGGLALPIEVHGIHILDFIWRQVLSNPYENPSPPVYHFVLEKTLRNTTADITADGSKNVHA